MSALALKLENEENKMLSEFELAQLCDRLGISDEAQAVIRNVRASEPSRLLGD